MKKSAVFLLLPILVSFMVPVKKSPVAHDLRVIRSANGKLYIRSSIVGGLRLSWLYLGNDGVFVVNPKHGADPVNFAMEKQDNAANTGHYTATAKMITVRYENGKTESWPVEYLNGRLNTIDGLFAAPSPVMPAGYKISGKYSSGTFYMNVGNIRTFIFNENGSFTLDGEGFINNSVAAAHASKSKGGTYTVYGNTLKLNFDTGETSSSVIGIYNAGSSRFLVINDSFFSQGK